MESIMTCSRRRAVFATLIGFTLVLTGAMSAGAEILVYGGIFAIENGYDDFNGSGFLQLRPGDCDGRPMCVATSAPTINGSPVIPPERGAWMIVPVYGQPNGSPVLTGHYFHLKNTVDDQAYYLENSGEHGHRCQDNYNCVYARKEAGTDGNTTWFLRTAEDVNGQQVAADSTILIRSNGQIGTFLSTRGRGCFGGLLCVSGAGVTSRSSTWPEVSGATWRFKYVDR
jgi:hypothetical protein